MIAVAICAFVGFLPALAVLVVAAVQDVLRRRQQSHHPIVTLESTP